MIVEFFISATSLIEDYFVLEEYVCRNLPVILEDGVYELIAGAYREILVGHEVAVTLPVLVQQNRQRRSWLFNIPFLHQITTVCYKYR